jgi:hypothetical protein
MPERPVLARLRCRLAWQRAVHDPAWVGTTAPRLRQLRAWQAARLHASFADLLDDPAQSKAAGFFFDELYGEADFSGRDDDIRRVLPAMQRLLPEQLLDTVSEVVALSALSQGFDLRLARWLDAARPRVAEISVADYVAAYAAVAHPRARTRQLAQVERAGMALARAVALPGVGRLLRASRLPARVAGVAALQQFLERGFAAMADLPDGARFVRTIVGREREMAAWLAAGDVARVTQSLPNFSSR